MTGSNPTTLKTQRGVSITGLVMFLAIALGVAMIALKVIPFYLEYNAAKSAIFSAKQAGGSVAEMRASFDKNAEINSIKVIKGRDLIVTKVGNQNELAFDYEPRIDLFGNVALLIHFTATTDPSGKIPPKQAEADVR